MSIDPVLSNCQCGIRPNETLCDWRDVKPQELTNQPTNQPTLLQSWARCRRRLQVLGPRGIHQKMAKVKVDAIHPEIAARARVLLEQHSVAEAHSAGPGVLAIYKWVLCLCLLLLHSFPYNTNSVPCLFLSHSFPYNTNSAPCLFFSHSFPCSTNSASVCSFHTRFHAVQTLPVFVPFTLVPIQ